MQVFFQISDKYVFGADFEKFRADRARRRMRLAAFLQMAYNQAAKLSEVDCGMHEYSLTQSIVRAINGAVRAHGAVKAVSATVVVGENTAVIPESVQLYFDLIAKGTPAEGAVLRIHTRKAEMRCPRCGTNFIRPRFSFACPACGTLGNPTDVGNEFYVSQVELDDGR